MRESCVYCTYYKGDKMPSNYIGSVYADRIENGYHGSVSSKKWKDIWKYELKNHPELFETEILMRFSNRQDATNFEELLQRKLDVVKSDMYINEVFANKGFCNTKHSEETKIKISEANKGKVISLEQRKQISIAQTGRKQTKEHIEKAKKNKFGKNNSSAKKINIYNKEGECLFETHGTFSEVCKENNLPYKTLIGSYQNDSRKIYMFHKVKEDQEKFIGWSAKIIS